MLKKLIFPLLSTSMLVQGSNLVVLADEFDNPMNDIEVFEEEMDQESSLTGYQFSEAHEEINFNFNGLHLVDSSDPQKTVQFSVKPAKGPSTITLKSAKGYGIFDFVTERGFQKTSSGEYQGNTWFPSGNPIFPDQNNIFTAVNNSSRGGWKVINIFYTVKGNNLKIELEDKYGGIFETWSFVLPQDTSTYLTTQRAFKGFFDEDEKPVYEIDGLHYQIYGSKREVAVECASGNTAEVITIPASIEIGGYEYIVTEVGHRHNRHIITGGFSTAPNLKKVIVESGVSKINGEIFAGCEKLEEVILPDTIKDIGPATFAYCTSLNKISIPPNIKGIKRGVFSHCSSLTSIELPDGLEYITMYGFENCSNLSKIVIPSSVSTIEGNDTQNLAFWDTPNLVIYGYKNTKAQKYATKYGIPFKELDLEPLPNTPSNGEMHRLYNPNSGEHFYTGNPNEKNQLSSLGWKYEGIAWHSPQSSNTPVYRLYNKNSSDHHYTTDPNEKDTLVRSGWKDEGIGWYSDDQKGVALYRVYNPNTKQAGSHHYTTDSNERNTLVSRGWKDEGIAWYGLKSE